MFSVPIIPVVADRPALKDGNKHKEHAKANIEENCSPEEPSNHISWKDPQVEEQERKLQECNLGKVQNLHGVEHMHEVCDLLWCKGPDVPADSIGNDAVHR